MRFNCWSYVYRLRATTVREWDLIILPSNACYIAVVVRTCHLLYGQTIFCLCCTERSAIARKLPSFVQNGAAMIILTRQLYVNITYANVCAIYGWEMTCTTTTVALPKAEKVFYLNFTMNICFYSIASL